ncbi:MAG TPA: hypothetical protein VGD65_17370 [Chryseosolibacter sp.]
MRKLIPALAAMLLLVGCQQSHPTDKDFIDKLLDLAIQTTSEKYSPDEYVQLTNLYDSLAHAIPEDKDEKIILVERLKQRGFNMIEYGRGNFPPLGPRIVIVDLRKGDCSCSVSKIYYATVHDNTWQMAEGIHCKRKR